MQEEMEMNWSTNVPDKVEPQQGTITHIDNKNNSDISYIGNLISGLEDKLESLYVLVANMPEAYVDQNREIIRTLLDTDNIIERAINQLNLLNNLSNNVGQQSTRTVQQVIF